MEKKWKSYLLELFIVIIGVSIAFWLGQIAEDRREDETRKNYLSDIQADLQLDINLLDWAIRLNTEKQEKTYAVAQLFSDADAHQEEIIDQAMEIGNYSFFTPSDFTYQSIIASGDLKLINNKDIKLGLVRLNSEYKEIANVQTQFIQALDDNYFPYLIDNFDYTTFQPTNPNLHKSLRMKNFFMFTVNDLSSHLSLYKLAKSTTHRLDSLISLELK